jgi:hypothetical protein
VALAAYRCFLTHDAPIVTTRRPMYGDRPSCIEKR